MSDADFQRRVKMIEAGLADDFQTVNNLLKDDKYLWSFGPYLRAMSQTGTDRVEKSLKLPNLDRSTGFFDQMMTGAIQNAASGNEKEFLLVLLKHAPAKATAAQEGLSHVFNTLLDVAREQSSAEVVALLIRHGADVNLAAKPVEMQLAAQARGAAEAQAKLAGYKKNLGA